jgi:hypothetical protein
VERVWGGIPKISMMLDVQEVIMVTSKSWGGQTNSTSYVV